MSPTYSTAAPCAIHDGAGRLMGYVECRGEEPHFGPQAPSILLRREPPARGARVLDRTAA
jgi:hypothetical protein